MIYLDYAATTPMSDEALRVYNEIAKAYFGNTSSLHDIGSSAARLLDICRKELAKLIHADEKGIYFTSGGTESNVLAVRSLIQAHRHKGNHLITTAAEHASLHHLFQQLEAEGYCVTYLPIDSSGTISLKDLEEAITPQTILASIHHANSEIGTIQPIREIGQILRQHQVLFHSDCVQTFGKIHVDAEAMMIDSLSLSSHKIYGPKGIGAVYIHPSIKWKPCLPGTTHESGFRPGTVNVPGIASFVTAAQQICMNLCDENKRLTKLRKYFIRLIEKHQLPITIEGHREHVLPNIIGLSVHGVEGQYTMLECNRHGIAISTGSACQVGQQAPSRTMMAIGKSKEEAKQFVRISLGKWTTANDMKNLISVLENICRQFVKERTVEKG
ncbi:IscS subfamily cysteine desulfurase [Bacillus alveayuensis]|uniref:IscS subfamily cysteine desulfurase n=1 Tax=Aeribacillus alveayuensis TaxID=279215 RepID=UPI0005D0F989|nr:IscS subfamily cysteine desulfurase [Bacillus alveayuensis]